MRTLNRRRFLETVGLAAGAAFMAACKPTAPTAAPTKAAAEPAATKAEAAAEPAAKQAMTLELWTFVNTHARWFRSMAEDYAAEKNPDFVLNVSELSDMHDKAMIALQAGGVGAPDLVDLEQGSFGGFLRGGDPGLVDLTDWLKEGGYWDKLVATRQALYTYKGKCYGVEHALCPVVHYYRADKFDEAGINVDDIKTWDDWIPAVKQLVQGEAVAINFPGHDVLLRQAGGDYFDADGNVALDSQLSIDTMQWILDLRDKHGVGRQDPGGDAWYAALKEDKFLSVIGADWYAGFIKDYCPELSGKWKAMPIPAFAAGGTRTSCSGGTGNCIVKYSKHIEEAWNFMQYSMLSVEGNVRRFLETTLFPPFIPAMTDERLHTPDEFFSGQDLGALFAELGPSSPAQYQSPYRSELNTSLGPLWQDIYDGNIAPAEAFKQVADAIRQTMAEEA